MDNIDYCCCLSEVNSDVEYSGLVCDVIKDENGVRYEYNQKDTFHNSCLEVTSHNINVIQNLKKEDYPCLYKYINRLRSDIYSKLLYAKEKSIVCLRKDIICPMFFCSLRYFNYLRTRKEGEKYDAEKAHKGNQQQYVNRYALLGLIEKMPSEMIPSKMLENSNIAKEKFSAKEGLDANRIQYYYLNRYTELLLYRAEKKARVLKKYNVYTKGITRSLVHDLFGEKEAVRVFPLCYEGKRCGRPAVDDLSFKEVLANVVVSSVRKDGYALPARIVKVMQKEYDWTTVTERRVASALPVILKDLGMALIFSNKYYIQKYKINSSGFPKIIVDKENYH